MWLILGIIAIVATSINLYMYIIGKDYKLATILSNPQIGSVIEGTGGLRKVQFALNEGKSGGIRVLYIDLVVHEQVYLISAFSKGSKDNLTKSQKNEIKKVIDQLKKSVDERRLI